MTTTLAGQAYEHHCYHTQETYLLRTDDPVDIIASSADNLIAKVVRLGWVRHNATDAPWCRAKANPNSSELVFAILYVASCGFHLQNCVGARIGNGTPALTAVPECQYSIRFAWPHQPIQECKMLNNKIWTEGTGRVPFIHSFIHSFIRSHVWQTCGIIMSNNWLKQGLHVPCFVSICMCLLC